MDVKMEEQEDKREPPRNEMLVVYCGPNVDDTIVNTDHLKTLLIVDFKGCVLDTVKGTKAVWVRFNRQVRREQVRTVINLHNSVVCDSLQIELEPDLDKCIIRSVDRQRLQKHPVFLKIMEGEGTASFWESGGGQ